MIRKAQASGDPYDAVICDWNMPEVSGLDLLKQIRSDTVLKDLPFIMLTAEGEMTSIMKVMQYGASEYIIKPFAGEALRKKLSMVLETARKKSA
jgi:two-component system chemotaxis response regulator CheY